MDGTKTVERKRKKESRDHFTCTASAAGAAAREARDEMSQREKGSVSRWMSVNETQQQRRLSVFETRVRV